MENKNLFLMRHAKSDWNIEVEDWLRPLKKRGIQAAKDMGHWMRDQHLEPDIIISSPAKRAISTAKKVCKAMGLDPAIIQQDERVYNATVALLTQVLRECPSPYTTVLLVGHNPALELLLTDLVTPQIEIPDDGKLLPTAALAQLQFKGDWSALKSQSTQLVALTRVKSIQSL